MIQTSDLMSDRYTENPISLNDNLSDKSAHLFFDEETMERVLKSTDDKVNNQMIETIFFKHLKTMGITRSPEAGITKIGSGGNGMVYRIGELDVAVSIITHLINNGLGIVFGFKNGTLPKMSIDYNPSMSMPSMLGMIKRAMVDHAVKMIWKSRVTKTNDPMLAIKIQLLTDSEMVEDVRHENAVHAELSSNDQLSSLIPAMYAAATIAVKVPRGKNVGIRVTFMRFIAPTYKPLSAFLKDPKVKKKRQVREKVYAHVRDAFIDLWAAGYAHGDAHSNNIVVNNRTKNISFYDFGMTVKLDPAVQRLCKSLQEARNKDNVNKLQDLLDECIEQVHDNMLRVLKRRFPSFGFVNLDPLMVKAMRIWVDSPGTRPVPSRIMGSMGSEDLAPHQSAMNFRNAYVPDWYLQEDLVSSLIQKMDRVTIEDDKTRKDKLSFRKKEGKNKKS